MIPSPIYPLQTCPLSNKSPLSSTTKPPFTKNSRERMYHAGPDPSEDGFESQYSYCRASYTYSDLHGGRDTNVSHHKEYPPSYAHTRLSRWKNPLPNREDPTPSPLRIALASPTLSGHRMEEEQNHLRRRLYRDQTLSGSLHARCGKTNSRTTS